MAALTDPVAEVGLRTWIARLRTDRVAIFRASVSRTFNAAAEASGVTGLAVEDLAAAIVSAVEDSVAAASADSAVAVGAVDGKNLGLGIVSNFPYN